MSVILRCPIFAISSLSLKSDEETRLKGVSETLRLMPCATAMSEYEDEILEDTG